MLKYDIWLGPDRHASYLVESYANAVRSHVVAQSGAKFRRVAGCHVYQHCETSPEV